MRTEPYQKTEADPGKAIDMSIAKKEGAEEDSGALENPNTVFFGNNEYPHCNYHTCFACYNGFCTALTDNNFAGYPCPFYKSKSQLKKEQKEEVERLQNGDQTVDIAM